VAISVVYLATGCHEIAKYHSPPKKHDQGSVGQQADVGPPDSSKKGDLTASDLPIDRQKLADIAPDRQPPDLGPCPEGSDENFSIDFEPADCNRQLYRNDFVNAAGMNLGSGFIVKDGWLQQVTDSSGFSFTTAATNLPTTSYMVQTRFELGPKDSEPYRIGLMARVNRDVDRYLVCEFIKGDIGLSRVFEEPDGALDALDPSSRLAYPSAYPLGWSEEKGARYVMQLWVTKTDHDGNVLFVDNELRHLPIIVCRILPEGGGANRQVTYALGNEHQSRLPAIAGTVGVRTFGRTAKFDYLKVYSLHRTGL
jgi:hypothetical protein